MAQTESTQAPLMDDPEAGQTWVVSLAGIIILSVLVIAICVFFFRFENKEVDEKVVMPANAWSQGMRLEQEGELAKYQKYSVAAPDGSMQPRIRIPISRAMEIVAERGVAAPTAP
ncbi:MAG: hypothetical protein FJ285_00910 [Planctomycetes bacterium]|nr:hypothetical protein [Planctomycetota bacterium]